MLNKKTTDNIIKIYQDTKSIYKAAKDTGVTYQTAKRILINNNIYIYNNINNINNISSKTIDIKEEELIPINNNNINIPDIKSNDIEIIDNKDIEVIEDKNIDVDSLTKNKKHEYNKKIDNVLSLILKEYKNNINKIPKSKLGIDFGIFYDKRFPKDAINNQNIENKTLIFNNFGDNKKLLELITQIQGSKSILPNQ